MQVGSTFEIKDSHFEPKVSPTNMATYKDIYLSAGNIDNCTFTSSTTPLIDPLLGESLYTGSVISIWNSQVNITNSMFSNLTGKEFGGAIFISNNSTAYIKSTIFKNNRAE